MSLLIIDHLIANYIRPKHGHTFYNYYWPESVVIQILACFFLSFLFRILKANKVYVIWHTKKDREEHRNAVIKKIRTDKKYAKEVFQRAGIIDENGNLTEIYR